MRMKSLRLTNPYALILVGLPGSGKTYFGEKFSETFSAPFINAGTIALYTNTLDDAYELTERLAGEMMRTSQTFIIETDMASRVRRTELSKSLRQKGYQPLIVWIQTDEPTAYQRSRKHMSDDEYVRRQRTFSPPHAVEHALVISGKHTYASQAKVILNYLARQNGRTETPLETPARPEPRPAGPPSRITIQ